MRTNLDEVDRIVRGVTGIWLVFVALSAFRSGRRTIAAISGVAALGLLQNAAVGYCGGNRLFGIDTAQAGDSGT